MDKHDCLLQIGFYENELKENILPFWLERCEDKDNGGYFNCFTNDGKTLVSTDKYTWSQGRFLWLFSKLSRMSCSFTAVQRSQFLRLAKSGRDFLVKHCFLEDEPLRCVFLMDAKGNPKPVDGYDSLDMSIYADGFVMGGLCQYSIATGDRESYEIARRLYESIMDRYVNFRYKTLPYPISPEYVMHGFYMSRILHSYDITCASDLFDPDYAKGSRVRLKDSIDLLLSMFVDENNNLREVVHRDGSRVSGVFGNHSNPGHICEEMWFIQHAASLLGLDSYTEQCSEILRKGLRNGWDETYGGLYHFCSVTGGEPKAGKNDPENEIIYQQLMTGWQDKLWWTHSEALYSTLLFGTLAGDMELLDWNRRIFDYTFKVFPNPDREVGEWIQIQTRDGKPQQKVTALPVKDPFHIIRNLIYIIEYLYRLKDEMTISQRRR